jgi:pterin-4a-carbinolamine dehydratase
MRHIRTSLCPGSLFDLTIPMSRYSSEQLLRPIRIGGGACGKESAAHRIERSFRFRNFQEALTFVQEIGELAEAERHHPNISFGWGNATVSLQTKKIKGLHENDFIMATKIDRIFARTVAG